MHYFVCIGFNVHFNTFQVILIRTVPACNRGYEISHRRHSRMISRPVTLFWQRVNQSHWVQLTFFTTLHAKSVYKHDLFCSMLHYILLATICQLLCLHTDRIPHTPPFDISPGAGCHVTHTVILSQLNGTCISLSALSMSRDTLDVTEYQRSSPKSFHLFEI